MFAAIRSWIDRNVGQLKGALAGGFFVVDTKQKKELILNKVVVEMAPKRFLSLFPVFTLRTVSSVGFTQLLTEAMRSARTALATRFRQTPKQIVDLARTGLVKSTADRIGVATASVGKKTDELFKGLDEQHVRGLVRSDRNAFRQKLLEELGKQASNAFAELTRKHLAELVLRVREETCFDGKGADVETDKNGSLALPTGTRFCVRKGSMTVFVIEQQPQNRTLRIMESNGERGKLYELSFPYVVFFVVMRGRKSDKMYAFFRKKPLRDMKDALLCAGLPNMYQDFQVCFSPSIAKDTMAETVEETIGNYWGGRFVDSHDPGNLTNQVSYENWSAGTKKDSLFGLSYMWRQNSCTVASMIKKIGADFAADSAKPRRDANGKQIMSALDEAVANIAAKVNDKMKEVCFNLVPSWNTDEALLAATANRFREIVTEVGAFANSECGKEIVSVLGEDSLKAALAAAVQETITSLEADASAPLEAAHLAFRAQLKDTANVTNTSV